MDESPLRILHVVGKMNRAGAEAMLMSLYRGIDRNEVQFDFLEFTDGTSDFGREIEELGGRVLKCKWSQNPTQIIPTRRAVQRVIEREGPYAAVHSHVMFASGIVLSAAKAAGVPFRVAHSHSTSDTRHGLVARSYRAMARWLIQRNSTSRVACSNEAGLYLFGHRFFEYGGVVLPNSVDLEKFHPMTSIEGQKFCTSETTTLVVVARLEPVKNHQFLIDLAAALHDRGANFLMKFVGKGSLETALAAAIAERGLCDQIQMLGSRSDVDEILRNSDALLMPSLWEGLPVALVEAQATGLPCLISDTISREADLGFDLLRFLSLDSVSAWADSIEAGFPSRPTSEMIRNTLETRGYTIESSLEKLLPLYGPQLGGLIQ